MIKSFIAGFTCFGISFPMIINQAYLLALVVLIGGILMFVLTVVTSLLRKEMVLKEQGVSAKANQSIDFLITKKYAASLSSQELNKVAAILHAAGNTHKYN